MNDVQQLGAVIAELRKNKDATQDELAAAVGVSAQAVSKWERGGVPDAALFPAIADFFDVSIDMLFGREGKRENIHEAVQAAITDRAPGERADLVLELCWSMEKALFGTKDPEEGGALAEYAELPHPQHSSWLTNTGMTQMKISKPARYFFLLPGEAGLPSEMLDREKLTELFAALGQKDFLETLLFFSRRESTSFFTEALLSEKLGMTPERAHEVVMLLKRYCLLWEQHMELDDKTQVIYKFEPSMSVTAMLLFAQECITPPNYFTYYMGGREKPYIS